MGLDLATNVLKSLETSSSLGMFARDTGGCLISRLGLSRSKDEAREISIAEISESALFYFSAPMLAKGSANFISKKIGVNKDEFTTPIKELKNIDPDKLKKIKLGKFGQIMSTFGLILPVVFAIAPVRNMVTLGETGKDKFTKVVELDSKKEEKKKEEAKEKTVSLIKKLGLVSALTLGGALSIIKGSKNEKIYKALEPIIDKVVKNLDFTKKGDLELMHYAALIYPVSIASYFYASRDKYEKAENMRRFSITVPLLFCGEKLIQNPIHKFFDKKFNTNIMDENGIKSYKDILKLPDTKERANMLKSKNFSYGLTFLTNTILIAGAVALLNRISTKKSYEKEQKEKIKEGQLENRLIFNTLPETFKNFNQHKTL